MSKKTFFLSMLIVVLPTLRLLNIHDINSKSQDKNLLRSKVKLNITKTSQTQHVTKFKSRKSSSTSNNWFQNMQNQNLATNSSVFLSNKASFKYQVGYSNYNAYGAKNSNFHVTVAKNTTHQIINIGTNSISAITVKVLAPGQKWADLTITNNFTPTKDMIPTSIHYLILGAKNINNANVSLNIVYERRKNPITPITVKIGYFNVNNINKNVGTVLSDAAIAGIVIGCVLTAMLALGCGIYFLWKRTVVKTATTEIGEIMALAKYEATLRQIELGNILKYGEGRRLTENFVEETDIMVKRADHTKLFTGVNKVTKKESIDEMIIAIDKVETARLRGVVARRKLFPRVQEIPKFKATELETNSVIGLKDKGLDGNTGPASPTTEPILPSDNSDATNIPKWFEEATTPVNPIEQVSGEQDTKLTEQEVIDSHAEKVISVEQRQEELRQKLTEENAMKAELAERTTEGKDWTSVREVAGTGERETVSPIEEQEDNDLGEYLSDVTEPATEFVKPVTNITEEQSEHETVSPIEEQEDNDLGEYSSDVTEPATEFVKPVTNITEEQSEHETVLPIEEQEDNDLGEYLSNVTEPATEVVKPGTNITEEQSEHETVLPIEEQEDIDLGEDLGDVTEPATEFVKPVTNITEEQSEHETVLPIEEQEDIDLGEDLGNVQLGGVIESVTEATSLEVDIPEGQEVYSLGGNLGDVRLDGMTELANQPALPENRIENNEEEHAARGGVLYTKDNIWGGYPLISPVMRRNLQKNQIQLLVDELNEKGAYQYDLASFGSKE